MTRHKASIVLPLILGLAFAAPVLGQPMIGTPLPNAVYTVHVQGAPVEIWQHYDPPATSLPLGWYKVPMSEVDSSQGSLPGGARTRPTVIRLKPTQFFGNPHSNQTLHPREFGTHPWGQGAGGWLGCESLPLGADPSIVPEDNRTWVACKNRVGCQVSFRSSCVTPFVFREWLDGEPACFNPTAGPGGSCLPWSDVCVDLKLEPDASGQARAKFARAMIDRGTACPPIRCYRCVAGEWDFQPMGLDGQDTTDLDFYVGIFESPGARIGFPDRFTNPVNPGFWNDGLLESHPTLHEMTRSGNSQLIRANLVQRYGISTHPGFTMPAGTDLYPGMGQGIYWCSVQILIARYGSTVSGLWQMDYFPLWDFAIEPDGHPDGCRGIDDIFAFLAAWFAGDARADADQCGACEAGDIFAFLSEWFRSE